MIQVCYYITYKIDSVTGGLPCMWERDCAGKYGAVVRPSKTKNTSKCQLILTTENSSKPGWSTPFIQVTWRHMRHSWIISHMFQRRTSPPYNAGRFLFLCVSEINVTQKYILYICFSTLS